MTEGRVVLLEYYDFPEEGKSLQFVLVDKLPVVFYDCSMFLEISWLIDSATC